MRASSPLLPPFRPFELCVVTSKVQRGHLEGTVKHMFERFVSAATLEFCFGDFAPDPSFRMERNPCKPIGANRWDRFAADNNLGCVTGGVIVYDEPGAANFDRDG